MSKDSENRVNYSELSHRIIGLIAHIGVSERELMTKTHSF